MKVGNNFYCFTKMLLIQILWFQSSNVSLRWLDGIYMNMVLSICLNQTHKSHEMIIFGSYFQIGLDYNLMKITSHWHISSPLESFI